MRRRCRRGARNRDARHRRDSFEHGGQPGRYPSRVRRHRAGTRVAKSRRHDRTGDRACAECGGLSPRGRRGYRSHARPRPGGLAVGRPDVCEGAGAGERSRDGRRESYRGSSARALARKSNRDAVPCAGRVGRPHRAVRGRGFRALSPHRTHARRRRRRGVRQGREVDGAWLSGRSRNRRAVPARQSKERANPARARQRRADGFQFQRREDGGRDSSGY
jgi:hypothetical protein